MPDEAAALHRIAKQLLEADADEEEIYRELMKEGIDRSYAEMILDNVLNDLRDRKDFYKMLVMGIFTVAGGLLLNFLSYNYSMRTGALGYYVFWGVVVAGIVMLIKAVGMYRNLPSY